MDSVRFGRALGVGARAAAKSLAAAADAAAAPSPSRPAPAAPSNAPRSGAAATGERTAQRVTQATAQAQQTGRGLKEGGKRFGEAAWRPFVRLSGVLWLEVTGVFFGLFAVFAIGGAWKLHDAWRETPANHEAHMHLLWAIAMAAVFGYFCLSSFVRARHRERRP